MQGLSDGAAPQLLSRGQRGYGTIVLVRCIQCILVDMTLDAPKIVQYTPLYAPNPICSVVLLMTAIFGGGATVATT